jgi:hypothetical protein
MTEDRHVNSVGGRAPATLVVDSVDRQEEPQVVEPPFVRPIPTPPAALVRAPLADPPSHAAPPAASPPAAPRPVSPPVPAAPDTTAPTGTLTAGRSQSRATVARRGLPLTTTCSEACAVRSELRLGRTVLARGSKRLTRAGTARLRLKLSASARRRVRARRVTATLRTTITDAAGNSRVLTRRVTLR